MATSFSPCKGFYVLNQFPSNVMFGMNGFHVSASGAIQGHHGPLVSEGLSLKFPAFSPQTRFSEGLSHSISSAFHNVFKRPLPRGSEIKGFLCKVYKHEPNSTFLHVLQCISQL